MDEISSGVTMVWEVVASRQALSHHASILSRRHVIFVFSLVLTTHLWWKRSNSKSACIIQVYFNGVCSVFLYVPKFKSHIAHYMYLHILMYVYPYLHTYNTYMLMHNYVCKYEYICIYTHIYMHIYTYVRVCLCVQINICTVHMCVQRGARSKSSSE